MVKQCQHLTITECYRILNLSKNPEDMLNSTLCTWNTTPVDLELKYNTKPV